MRLATVFDLDDNEPRPVFELPGGQRVLLRELFRSGSADLDRLPIYFSDLSSSVQFLDDVLDAARDWAHQRAELVGDKRGDETLSSMPADDTPGSRTSVGKYEVAIRATP